MALTSRSKVPSGLGVVLVGAVMAAGLTVGGCIIAWFAVEQHGEVVSAHRVLLEEIERFARADRDRDASIRRLIIDRDPATSSSYANATAEMQRALTSLDSLARRIDADRAGVPIDSLAEVEATALQLAALGKVERAVEVLNGPNRRIARGNLTAEMSAIARQIENGLIRQEHSSRGRASLSLLIGIGSFVVSLASWIIVARGLRRRERELTETTHHARLLGMVASRTAAAVTIMDAEGKIVWVNEGWERITGINLQEASQTHAWSMFQAAGMPSTAIDAMRGAMAAGVGCRIEVPLRSDRNWLWTRLEFEPVDDPNFGRRYMTMQVDLSELKQTADKLHRAEFEMRRVFSAIPGLVVSLDENERIVHRSGDLGSTARRRSGAPVHDAAATLADLAREWDIETIRAGLRQVRSEGQEWSCDHVSARADDGSERTLAVTASRLTSDGPGTACALLVVHDVTDRAQLTEQLERSRRLESIGQLAAGVAHEINTPAQFVSDNLRFAREAIDAFEPVLQIATRLATPADANLLPSGESEPEMPALPESPRGAHGVADDAGSIDQSAPDATVADGAADSTNNPDAVDATPEALHAAIQAGDLEFLREEVPAALDQALDGMDRIASIVHSMKEFSHPGERQLRATDVNRVIESSCRVCRNEWKYIAELHLQLSPDAADADCVPGELGQVILNLVVNAAHAIKARIEAEDANGGSLNRAGAGAVEHDMAIGTGGPPGGVDGAPPSTSIDGDVSPAGRRGYIGVATRDLGDEIEILVRDDGIGMDESLRLRIFDPFFTTKDVGKGTGQGLALVHAIIVDKYSGRVDVQSAVGRGSIFRVVIPRHAAVRSEVAA